MVTECKRIPDYFSQASLWCIITSYQLNGAAKMELNQERQLEAAKLLKQMVVTLQQNIEDNKLSQDEINSVIGDVLQLIVDNF